MIRLYIYCEGQTEEGFVTRVLSNWLSAKNIFATPIIAATKRTDHGKYKGGTVPYPKMKKEILQLCADTNAYVTTMFDFYALSKDVPGRKNPVGTTIYEIADYVENEWKKDINKTDFIPNIMMHEFEGLLFTKPDAFAYVDSRLANLAKLQSIREQFDTPEHINNSTDTAPSKRIFKIYPDYDKLLHGIPIAERIGLSAMMGQCAHFRDWVHKLEALEAPNL